MMSDNKIVSLETLKENLSNLRKEGKKIVQCHGCFDLLHIGHIKHFQAAKREGDVLVVTVTSDDYVRKGPGRPFFSQDLRLQQLAALECVDYVALNQWPTAVEVLEILKPDVYAKGGEVLGNANVDAVSSGGAVNSSLDLEAKVVAAFGGTLHLTDEYTSSSSRIINQIGASLPDATRNFLHEFKSKQGVGKVIEVIDSMRDVKVLVIGDAILDQYIFCHPMEKTGKEAMVAHRVLNSEMHIGGAFAIANHVAGFAKEVGLITCVGNNHLPHIKQHMKSGVGPFIFRRDDLETLVKTRYINGARGAKLLEVYNVQDFPITEENEKEIIGLLADKVNGFDMILASDFGHGLLTPKIIDYLAQSGKFLAVNAQLNAGNLGYNFITKYPRADFVSLNEREIRLPTQDRGSDIKSPMKKLTQGKAITSLNVTLGGNGAIYYSNGTFYSAPAFTQEILDTIGSGDAFLAVSSLLSYKKVDPAFVPFLGNAAGALAVRIMGNRESIDAIELKRFVNYMMK